MSDFEWNRDEVEPVIRAVEKVTGTPWFSIGVDLGNGVRYISDQRALTYDDRTAGALCAVAFLSGVVEGAKLSRDLIPDAMGREVASAYQTGLADGKAIKADG